MVEASLPRCSSGSIACESQPAPCNITTTNSVASSKLRGAADGSLTAFASLPDKCLQAYIRDKDGNFCDVAMDKFFEALVIYREAQPLMGKTVQWILADFDSNYAVSKAEYEADVKARKTLRGFLQTELDARIHQLEDGNGHDLHLKDPSGACQLQWLLRALEFFLTMLHLLFVEGDNHGASNAYATTLSQYHGWMTSVPLRALLSAMPGRDSICAIEALCPKATSPESRARAISDDIVRVTSSMLPLVTKMIMIFKEFHLWECRRV